MAPQPQCNRSWRLYSLCNKEQRSPVGNIASMSTGRQELPMLQGNLCMMRDTSRHRQPLHPFSLIAVRANYYPTIYIHFDHPHYHFIANISFIPTWGIISVKYTHYGRLLWAALLIISAHMDNGSSKKNKKKIAKPNYGPTWNFMHQGCFSSSPFFGSRSLFTFPGSRFLERHPHVPGRNECLGGQVFHQQQGLLYKYP